MTHLILDPIVVYDLSGKILRWGNTAPADELAGEFQINGHVSDINGEMVDVSTDPPSIIKMPDQPSRAHTFDYLARQWVLNAEEAWKMVRQRRGSLLSACDWRSEAFYTQHFGLSRTEVVTWKGHRAVFLRHGNDHHAIGLFPAALREALELDQGTKLFSFGIELGSYQQLKDAVSWLRTRGANVSTDLPSELQPGIDYSAFVRDPSGHTAMLYCGIEQVGWDGAAPA